VIAHLTGTLLEKHVQRLVVDVAGVGYDVQVPLSTFYAVGDPGTRIALRIHTHVREDALQLFGFLTPLELTMFERLLSVQGIGPKVALSVLSGIEPGDLVRAIRNGDVARLVKIPGVGRKTGERLVLELKDRLPDTAAPIDDVPVEGGDLRDDVLSALGNLGYQRSAAEKSVDRVLKTSGAPATFEALLRDVLKVMAG
jgi:Holliday junction DNA helicase RuvA